MMKQIIAACAAVLILSVASIAQPKAAYYPGPTDFRLGAAQVKTAGKLIGVKFNWQPSIGAARYRLVVCRNASLTDVFIEKTVTTNKAALADVPAETKLYWRVEADFLRGKKLWSAGEPGVFTTPAPPADKVSITVPKGSATVDGKISPGEWDNAAVIKLSNYFSGRRDEGDRDPVARLMWDDKALYVLCDVGFPGARSYQATELPRDGMVHQGDSVEIFLYGPGRSNSYHLMVNALNSIYDAKAGETGWNGDWQHAAEVRPGSMTVEIGIPFKSVGEVPEVGAKWRGNILVNMNVQSLVPCWSKEAAPFGQLERMGVIVLGK